MRSIPPDMQADLETGLTTHCHGLRVERADGAVFGFTDHDEALEIDGLIYRGGGGFTLTGLEMETGLAPGRGDLVGSVSDELVREDELAAGLWDRADVQVWRIDWRDVERRILLASGHLGEVRLKDGRFEADWLGLADALNRVVGRRFTRQCDAALGDARCRVPAVHPGFASGCDKQFATCRDRFGNTLNFRGFPYLVGNDVLIAGATSDVLRDGGSRGLGG